MSLRVLSLAAAFSVLAICGGAIADQPPADGPSQWDAGQKAQFNATFAKTTHDSCLKSAQSHGATADAAERYCSCVVDQLAPLSVEDKMALPQHDDRLTAASNACKPH